MIVSKTNQRPVGMPGRPPLPSQDAGLLNGMLLIFERGGSGFFDAQLTLQKRIPSAERNPKIRDVFIVLK
jgi:hypothetical protein